ncbi:MAG TPA: ABC transporter permease [Candidatus Limnocylindrales bacterium]|jgi:peptide/nickel transport system permease protein|nr:ABC transporter permease [Candidatus Limnocylindrales bacterium]
MAQGDLAAPLRLESGTVAVKSESPGRRALRRFLRHRLAIVGLITIGLIAVLALIGSEEAALKQNLRLGFPNQPPGKLAGYLLGTDALGRDVLARTLVGGRISILVAIISVAIATGIGTTIGVIAGYAGGWVDMALMRFVDIVLSFPTILLLLVMAFLIGPGLATMMIIIGLVTWAPGARIIRGQVLALRETTFIEAARVIGVSGPRMIGTHILPNIVAPLVVFATFGVASVIVFEASLSYLGLGVQPPTPSWGNLVHQTRVVTVLERQVWQWAPAAVFIVLMVLAVNFVGDGLRDAFDQRATSDR